MPKNKCNITKRHEELINIVANVPDLSEVKMNWWSGAPVAHRENAEEALIDTIKVLTKNTMYEDTCNEIISKIKDIFEYFDNKEN